MHKTEGRGRLALVVVLTTVGVALVTLTPGTAIAAASPHVDKAFTSAVVDAGAAATLTYVITNTRDRLAKPGWSFTDRLADGLSVADEPRVTTDCPGGKITGTSGVTTVDVAGGLGAGQASCRLTIDVIGAAVDVPYLTCDTDIGDPKGVTPTAGCASVIFKRLGYTLTKSSAPAAGSAVGPGATVTYTLTLTNTTDADLVRVSIVDNLRGVLDDASDPIVVSADEPAVATINGSTVEVSLTGTIPPTRSLEIKYAVKVRTTGRGDRRLISVVTDNGGNCPSAGTPESPQCTSTLSVRGQPSSEGRSAKVHSPGGASGRAGRK